MKNHKLETAALCIAVYASALGGCKPEPARPPAPIEPDRIVIFEGAIRLARGGELPYRAIVAPKPASAGAYVGTIDIPKQALSGAGLERIVYQVGRRIEFELPFPGTPRWTGDVHADGSVTCVFTQGDITLACTMRDTSSRPVLASD